MQRLRNDLGLLVAIARSALPCELLKLFVKMRKIIETTLVTDFCNRNIGFSQKFRSMHQSILIYKRSKCVS